ncbi:MAG TPA: VOC family protein [Acidimicrobiales bacterium]|nr:VOC family protein [Acidimicrobiales bacterium]
MPDPLTRLRSSGESQDPRPAFARKLRRQIIGALDLDPSQLSVQLPGRIPMTTVSTSTVTTITPYLTFHDAAAAIDFYVEAFGAVEDFRVVGDGRIGHAEILIGDARIQMSDEFPEMGIKSPRTLGGAAAAMSLTVTDCDAVYERAVAAGAATERPPEDAAHLNRMAVIADPFGHRWFITQPLEPFDLDTYAERSAGTDFEVVAGPGAGRSPAAGPYVDGIWPALMYEDAPAAIEFVTKVLGFETQIVVPGDDPSVVVHSQLKWPGGGVVQIGSADREDNIYSRLKGSVSLYIVTDDPESVLARCEAAGADIADPLVEVDYGESGDRNFTVRDTEGNLWCFGTYAGAG